MSKKTRENISWIVHLVGFVMYVVFLNKNYSVSSEVWLNTLGACFSVLLFCISVKIRE